ncbi:UvrD-helicase domain-containing protein [candidate division KSB1 bacterium]|nr:UvrD-helicase domain-containing protein [candidate division KSB1 bacterium]
MQPIIKKVIRASAGTGKTYRLSLEYIGLLLQYRQAGINFNEILVITFTKKATAEIRANIFAHMDNLIRQTEKGRELQQNVKRLLNLDIQPDDLNYLRDVHNCMLTNKHDVRISTIDSFTNTIFKTMISPYLGLTSYEIDGTLDIDVLGEIYSRLAADKDQWAHLKAFFTRSGRRTIEEYQNLVQSLLENRWVLHFMRDHHVTAQKAVTEANKRWADFQRAWFGLVDEFVAYAQEAHAAKPISDLLKTGWFKFLHNPAKPGSPTDLKELLTAPFREPDNALKHDKEILGFDSFWHGNRVLRKKDETNLKLRFQQLYDEAMRHLADYLYVELLLPEQQEIVTLASLIHKQYDEIKFRDKVFTYSDVAYYTFANLYHPELSLVQGDVVTNVFYEQLASTIRFVLIDEFQDTSIIQLKILLPIIKEVISGYGMEDYGGVIVVGDEKQSIYGWRGGERDLLAAMPAILFGAEDVQLDTSYRSDGQIIAFVNALFSHPSLYENLRLQQIEWPYQPVNAIKDANAGYVNIRFRNYSQTEDNGNDIADDRDVMREFVERTILPRIRAGEINVSKSALLARKNADLQMMANVLDEYAVDYVLESTSTIVRHRTIKPIMLLFQFLVYKDIYDLLRFLRSDVVLLDPNNLKTVIESYRAMQGSVFEWRSFLKKLLHIPGIQTVYDLMFPQSDNAAEAPTQFPPEHLLGFAKRVVEKLNIIHIFNQENDVKNLHFFMGIIAGFLQARSEYAKTLRGFLEYCSDYEQHESFQQVGLEDANALTLLTIHKSKGLEFETVFVYWNLSAKSMNSHNELHYYTAYSPDFIHMTEAALTFNYDHILKASHRQGLSQQAAIRDSIEELNNLYVAITRAKSNLFLQFALQNSKGIEAFWNSLENKPGTPVDRLLALSLQQLMHERHVYHEQSAHEAFGNFGVFAAAPSATPDTERVEVSDRILTISPYIAFDNTQFIQQQELPDWEKSEATPKTMYLQNRRVDRGNVAHFYLSFIYYGEAPEKAIAAQQTLSKYGGLFPIDKLHGLFRQLDTFIDLRPDIFNRALWPTVFTERTVFYNNQTFRLDRMMVNHEASQVFIVDYKTGVITEVDQIDVYIEAVLQLPYVQKKGYIVAGEYVAVELGEYYKSL